jgi:hypothetical protein
MHAFDQDLRNYLAAAILAATGRTPTWVTYESQAEAIVVQILGLPYSAHCEEHADRWEFSNTDDDAAIPSFSILLPPGWTQARIDGHDED